MIKNEELLSTPIGGKNGLNSEVEFSSTNNKSSSALNYSTALKDGYVATEEKLHDTEEEAQTP